MNIVHSKSLGLHTMKIIMALFKGGKEIAMPYFVKHEEEQKKTSCDILKSF